MKEAGERPRWKAWLGWSLLALVGVILGSIAALPSPYVVLRPGPAFNVLGEYQSTPVLAAPENLSYESEGELDLLTLQLWGKPDRPLSWFEVFQSWLDPAESVVPMETYYPPNQSVENLKQEQQLLMKQSQQDAIAAALRQLGYRVDRWGFVAEVLETSPMSDKLQPDDWLVSIDGVKIVELETLIDRVKAYDGQKPFELKVLRAGQELSFEAEPALVDGEYRLGLIVGYQYDFPVEIELQLGEVGGPSGGMMFALGIYDLLTPGSLTGGESVAGTGTVTDAGEIGPIGGIRQKLYGAQRAGANWFLIPVSNCREAEGITLEGLRLVAVEKLSGAISSLEQIAKKQTDGLPGCPAD